jgi:hypothetical protein
VRDKCKITTAWLAKKMPYFFLYFVGAVDGT